MSGDTIFMPKNAMMMIHNPWTIGMGNAIEFRKLAEDLDKIRESLVAAYEGHSTLTRDEIIELMDEETWLTATECEEYGFCDVVEEEKQLVASIDKTLLTRYKNTPREFLDKPKPDDDKENKILKQKLLMELEL
jgi:ATP-dependent Clp protease protease subunit